MLPAARHTCRATARRPPGIACPAVMPLPVVPPIAPTLARLTRELPGGDLLYEPRWDGFRCLGFRDGDEVDLRSRHDRPLARYFPEVVEALRGLPALELHPFLSTIERPTEPTALVKTSGSLGLHVFVPLVPGHTFDRTKAFGRPSPAGSRRRRPISSPTASTAMGAAAASTSTGSNTTPAVRRSPRTPSARRRGRSSRRRSPGRSAKPPSRGPGRGSSCSVRVTCSPASTSSATCPRRSRIRRPVSGCRLRTRRTGHRRIRRTTADPRHKTRAPRSPQQVCRCALWWFRASTRSASRPGLGTPPFHGGRTVAQAGRRVTPRRGVPSASRA